MTCSQIMVLNRVDAEEFEWPYPWGCISIANSEEVFAAIPRENRIALLQVGFADITQPTRGYIHFNDDHAFEILDFVTMNWDTMDLLVVHCDAGISRSSAVAAVISRLKFGDEGEFLESPFDPNPRVYRILREVAQGRGDYERDEHDLDDGDDSRDQEERYGEEIEDDHDRDFDND